MILSLLRGTLLILALLPQARALQGCVGCTPLSDLGTGLYLGSHEGGLYAGGSNQPPPAHRLAAEAAAAGIVPRDPSGAPDPGGRIAFVSISMSNCNQEYSAFERRADLDIHRNGRVTVFNGAESGQALDIIQNPNAPYWDHLTARLDAEGLSANQVQAVWLKMANAGPTTSTFPDHALELQSSARAVLQLLKLRFPHLAIAYLSSRTYGGNTSNPLRGEPLSYETGFATKWLIEEQIAGDPALNHDPQQGPVMAPLLLWGPYLWANGTIPRSDGLVWLPSDFEGDGIHPNADGEQKVAGMLEAFFQSGRPSEWWYGEPLGVRLATLDAVADAHVDASQPGTNFGSSATLRIQDGVRTAFVKFDLSGVSGTIVEAKLSLMALPNGSNLPGTELRGVSDTSWQEGTLTQTNAPAIDGSSHGVLPRISRGAAISFDVLDDVLAASGGSVSFALLGGSQPSTEKRYLSREGGEAPRLVLTVVPPCEDPGVPYCRSLPNSSGAPARLHLSGTASVLQNDLVLEASGLPGQVPGLMFYGFDARQTPFGDGLRCVAGPIARLNPPGVSSAAGVLLRPVDFNAPPLGAGPFQAGAGDMLHFQCWYRDPQGGPAGFNLSDACQVFLCP